MNLTLTRGDSTPHGTPGSLFGAGVRLYTIEPPWVDNEPNKSCVPLGDYQLMPYDSPTHGRTWRLSNPTLNVFATAISPGRSEIEIHVANYARELKGCIGVGLTNYEMLDPVDNLTVPAVQDSAQAMLQLRSLLWPGSGHTLTIQIDEG